MLFPMSLPSVCTLLKLSQNKVRYLMATGAICVPCRMGRYAFEGEHLLRVAQLTGTASLAVRSLINGALDDVQPGDSLIAMRRAVLDTGGMYGDREARKRWGRSNPQVCARAVLEERAWNAVDALRELEEILEEQS